MGNVLLGEALVFSEHRGNRERIEKLRGCQVRTGYRANVEKKRHLRHLGLKNFVGIVGSTAVTSVSRAQGM